MLELVTVVLCCIFVINVDWFYIVLFLLLQGFSPGIKAFETQSTLVIINSALRGWVVTSGSPMTRNFKALSCGGANGGDVTWRPVFSGKTGVVVPAVTGSCDYLVRQSCWSTQVRTALVNNRCGHLGRTVPCVPQWLVETTADPTGNGIELYLVFDLIFTEGKSICI